MLRTSLRATPGPSERCLVGIEFRFSKTSRTDASYQYSKTLSEVLYRWTYVPLGLLVCCSMDSALTNSSMSVLKDALVSIPVVYWSMSALKTREESRVQV